MLVSEVVGLDAAVEAEEEVGAALVVAQRLDEQLRAVGGDAEVRGRAARVHTGPLELHDRQTDGAEPRDDRFRGRPTRRRAAHDQHDRPAQPADREGQPPSNDTPALRKVTDASRR